MTASKLVALALAGVLFPALTLAQQASSAAEPTQQSMNIEQFDQEMAKAQENLKKMQDQMSLIHKTTDPVQRQKLMQDHQAMMQQGMLTMKGMMGCCGGMMGGRMMGSGHMMGWGQMGSHYAGMTPEQMKQHQYMMDRYMGMQQMMMDQMMQHQQQMGTPSR
ncbi:hypothetical protein AB1288_01245 [Pseudomonas putida]|uniref:hypothetical protein n=1 Tax=Pseudomonas TaxID=286 RepID=UPI00064624FE|nr:hypothetical protein [Pseudomonas putida]